MTRTDSSDSKLRSPNIVIGKKGDKLPKETDDEFSPFELSDVMPVYPPESTLVEPLELCHTLDADDSLFIKHTWNGKEYWFEVSGEEPKSGTVIQRIKSGIDPDNPSHGGYALPSDGETTADSVRVFDCTLLGGQFIEAGIPIVYTMIGDQFFVLETKERPFFALAVTGSRAYGPDYTPTEEAPVEVVSLTNIKSMFPVTADFGPNEVPVSALNVMRLAIEAGSTVSIGKRYSHEEDQYNWLVLGPGDGESSPADYRPTICLAKVAEAQATNPYTCESDPISVSDIRIVQPINGVFIEPDEAPSSATNPFKILVEPEKDVLITRVFTASESESESGTVEWMIFDPYWVLASPWLVEATVGTSETRDGDIVTDDEIPISNAIATLPPGARFGTDEAPVSFSNPMNAEYTTGEKALLYVKRNIPGLSVTWEPVGEKKASFKIDSDWNEQFSTEASTLVGGHTHTIISTVNHQLPLWRPGQVVRCEWRGRWEVVDKDHHYTGTTTSPLGAIGTVKVGDATVPVEVPLLAGTNVTIPIGKKVLILRLNEKNIVFAAEC